MMNNGNTMQREYLKRLCVCMEGITDSLLIAQDMTDNLCTDIYRYVKAQYYRNGEIDLTLYLLEHSAELTAEQSAFVCEILGTGYANAYEVQELKALALEEITRTRLSQALARCTQDMTTDTSKAVANLQEALATMQGDAGAEADKPTTLAEAFEMVLQANALARNPNRPDLFKTGFAVIDKQGFVLTEFNVIAGGSGSGKTALALNMAHNLAKAGVKVVFFSMEMSATAIGRRIASASTLISNYTYKNKPLTQEEFATHDKQTGEAERLSFAIYDKVNDINAIVRTIKAEARKGAQVFFVDYLQMLANSNARQREDEALTSIARTFKNLAMELNICICALSQLNRNGQEEGNKLPSQSAIKGAGGIVEASNNIWAIHRPEGYGVNNYPSQSQWANLDTQGTALLLTIKARDGELCNGVLSYNAPCTKFADLPTPPYKDNLPFAPQQKGGIY